MTLASPSPHEELLIGYVRAGLERLEAGEPVDPAELCSDHPELAAPVAEALGLAAEVPRIHEVSRSTDPLLGRVLGDRYRCEARLGMGAMGLVYSGTDLELQRPVAVKILDARLFHDETAEQRFLREAEVLASLDHDHIVAIHDRGRSEDGTLFLVMERLTGASLAAVLAEQAERDADEDGAWLADLLGADDPPPERPLRLTVRWAAELAAGLAAAHARGVFHRDVKPSNVFVRRDYRCVLLDFGIAARRGDPKLTLTRTVLGTPWYMAPEQAAGDADAGPCVDVYGLCATLYHMLTSRPPFEGEGTEVLVKLQTEDPVPARRLRADLPRDLQAILEKGMERDPRRRYRSMSELEQDLRAFLDHRPVSVRPLSPLGRLARRVRRRPARTLALGAATLAAGLLVTLGPMALRQIAQERRLEKQRLLASLPQLIALEGDPRQRMVASLRPEREESIALLTRILELDPNDLPARLVRAALSFDQGRREAGAADLRRLADQTHSPYVRALAERYLATKPQEGGWLAVDLGGLPEPKTAQEHFVAGFHELRNRHVPGFAARAEAHLRRAMHAYLPARDLRLIALLALAERERDRSKRAALYAEAYDEAVFLEGRYGRPTARTRATRGVSLLARGRYAEAERPLLDALRLRPARHGPLHNLGVVYRRLGKLDLAERYLNEAYALRPHFWNTVYTLAQVQRDRGRFDEALRTARSIPDDERSVWMRPFLVGNILTTRAIAARRQGDAAAARRDATAAIVALDRALGAESIPRHWAHRVRVTRAIAKGLRDEDLATAVDQMLNLLQSDPRNPYAIGDLATLLPAKGLDAEATWYLRLFLRRLAASLAEGDPRWQKLQMAERAKEARRKPVAVPR